MRKKNKTKLPLVSIVIPVYNGEKYMREAIDSALAQTYKNIEIIVVNDGSTDKTDEIARSYGDKIKYFVKENGGVSSALNYGIKKMRGDYFAWLSCDDRYLPEKIERAIELIPDDDEKAIIFTNFALIDEDGKRYAETKFESRVDLNLFSKDIYPVEKGAVNGDTILIHRKIFDKCGLFDETSRTVGDYMMWLKIFDKYRHVFSTDCLTEYRIHPEQATQKSPVYNAESDALAIKWIELITEKRAKNWGISLFQIYMDLYMQFKKAGFKKAADLAFKLGGERFHKDDISLSVLMSAHNAEKYIENAILSLLDSDFGDYELIVIDDGSIDKTRAIIEKYAKDDFRVRLMRNTINLGVAKSLNKALDVARGKYMTRLDSDDTMLPDRLTKQMLAFGMKGVKLVGTNINFMNESGSITREKVYGSLVAPCRFASMFTNPIPNATIIYDMGIVRKYGLKFDEVVVSEDYAFLLNFLEYGDGIMINEGLYNYRIRNNSLFHKNKDFAKEYGSALCVKYGEKIMPNLSSSELFRKINGFDGATVITLDDELLEKFIMEGEEIIAVAGKKFGFSEQQKNSCRVYLIREIFNRCSLATPTTDITRGLFGKVYHYYLDNGAKKTIKKILTLGKR